MPLPRIGVGSGAAGVVGAVLLAGLAVPVASAASVASAAEPTVQRPLVKVLRAPASSTETSPRLVRAAAAPAATRAPVSTWQVTYCGFEANPQAKEAFQAAVDVWRGYIDTPNDNVPIHVVAKFRDLGDELLLGQAGPGDYEALDTDGNGSRDTNFPIALANARTSTDLSPGTPACQTPDNRIDGRDITAEFNSGARDVYYGTDGRLPSPNHVDFKTIVLHELGHGLGMLGSMTVIGAAGYYDSPPLIYDRFTVRSGGGIQGKRLLSYANESAALKAALTSGGVYWDGPLGKAAYGGRPPRLFTPTTFEPASSYSHLSDVDFPAGDVNALMTSRVENNEVIHEPGPVVLGMFADMGYRTPQPPGHRYTPVDPVRVLDTRTGIGGTTGRLADDSTIDVRVVGGSTGVPLNAAAVVLNLTGLGGPSALTDISLFPTPRSGTARPIVSNLNLAPRDTRANLVTVPVGENGSVRVYNPRGAPHVLGDVQGWYGPGAASLYQPTDPVRLLDTREEGGSPVAAGTPLDLTVVGGERSVPASATAVILTVTALNATTSADVRVYPRPQTDGAAAPDASNLNLDPAEIVPNLVIAKVGRDGAVRVQVSAGSADIIVDLSGWYDEAGGGALFHPLAPARVLDTRSTAEKTVGPGGVVDLPVTNRAGVPSAGATAVVLNITGTEGTRTTDIRVYPTRSDFRPPEVSNLNLLPGQTAANLAVVRVGDPDAVGRGQVRLRNAAGEIALIADLAGWFGP